MRRGSGLAEVRIGPPHLPVQRVAVRKQPLRDALAHDHDQLAAAAVVVGEVAAGDQRDAEHREEARRDDAEPRARVLFAVGRRVALGGKRDGRAEAAGVAPRHEAADGDAVARPAARRCGAMTSW